MKRLIFSAVSILIMVVGFGGCAIVNDPYYVDPITVSGFGKMGDIKKKLYDEKLIESKCLTSTEVNNACKYQRNDALTTLIMASDEMCMEHISGIAGNEAATNFTLGTLTTAFAGASTLATVNISKSILAGLATFSSAERSLINDTFYKSILTPVIIGKICETRTVKRTALIKRMKDEDYA